jgi:hypothetical protein
VMKKRKVRRRAPRPTKEASSKKMREEPSA